MATGNPVDPSVLEQIRKGADFFAADLLKGVTNGAEIPPAVRDILLTIPNIDENIGTFRWMRRGNISTDLQSEPEDILESDIETLKTVISDTFTNAQSPEEIETMARFYLLSRFGADIVIPEGETATDQLQLAAGVKQYLRHITTPAEGQAASIMGADVAPYVIDRPNVTDPLDEDFIAGFSDALEQIQTDMRIMGTIPPQGEEHGLVPLNVPLDADIILETLEKAMEPLGDNPELAAIRAETDVNTRLDGYAEYVSMMQASNTQKAEYTALIDTLRPDSPVIDQIDLSRDLGVIDDYTHSRYLLSEIANVGNDRAGHFGEETTRQLDAYLNYMTADNDYGSPALRTRAEKFQTFLGIYNGLDEADRAAIADKLEHTSRAAPGIMTAPPPTSDPDAPAEDPLSPSHLAAIDVLTRMGAAGDVPDSVIASITNPGRIDSIPAAHLDEAFQNNMQALLDNQNDTVRLWFDSNNSPYEFVEQTDGTRALFRVDPPNNTLVPIPADQTPMLFEYQIQPDGQISKFILDGDQTYSLYADLQPVMLEKEFIDFDAFHSNIVTQRLLNKATEEIWGGLRTELGLESMGTSAPAATEVDEKIVDLEENIRTQIRGLYEARGQDLSNADIDAIYTDLQRSSPLTSEALQEKFRTNNAAEQQTAATIGTFLVQIQGLNEFKSTLATRGYSNYIQQGILPGGLHLGLPQLDIDWNKDWSQHWEQNEEMSFLRWDSIRDMRVLEDEVINIYDQARRTGEAIPASAFDSDEYAKSYIEQQGWGDELDTTQTAMITRALMMKESADRHGITDPNSAEARAVFVEDFRAGRYHLDDIEIFMRAFDADGQHQAAVRSAHSEMEYLPGQFDSAADVRHRAALFNEAFGVDVDLTDAQGNVIATAENATITRDDAVLLFWQSQTRREPQFERDNDGNPTDYNQSQYHIGYDEMVARHGADFVKEIENIMENRSLHQQFMVQDLNNPAGDMSQLYARRYQENVNDHNEVLFKRAHDIVAQEPASPITRATLDPALDTITAAPDPVTSEPEAQQPSSPTQDTAPAAPIPEQVPALPEEDEDANLRVTPEELRRAATDITMPPPELAAAMGGGMAPSTAPNSLFRPT